MSRMGQRVAIEPTPKTRWRASPPRAVLPRLRAALPRVSPPDRQRPRARPPSLRGGAGAAAHRPAGARHLPGRRLPRASWSSWWAGGRAPLLRRPYPSRRGDRGGRGGRPGRPGDHLDPATAAAVGVDLERSSGFAAEHETGAGGGEMLLAAGFPLVVIDLGFPPVAGGRGVEPPGCASPAPARAQGAALLVSSPTG